MSELSVDYPTLVHSGTVLERQGDHARSLEQYVRVQCDISDHTGLLLMALTPLSQIAVEIAAQVARGSAVAMSAASDQLRLTTASYAESDRRAHEDLARLVARLGGATPPWADPRADVSPLGAARQLAPSGYGESSSYLWDKAADIGSDLEGLVGRIGDVAVDVTDWRGPAAVVAEAVDPTSYLVPPTSSENWVQDLRWSAGALLGSVDWVAEQIFGYSILEECVFKPFGGDWRAIDRSSQAWRHGGSAFMAMSRNCAALTPATVRGWEGTAGDAFRLAMAAVAAAYGRVAVAFDAVSGLVSNVATASKLACSAIGFALRSLQHILLKLAAQLAVPVVGWAVTAVSIWWDIEKAVGIIRMIYSALEALVDAIQGMIDARQRLLDVVHVVEDVVEGAARRAAQAGT